MGPSETIECVDQYLVEKELSESEMLLRRAFVQEYMKNRSPYEACLELGFLQPYAEDWARAFMSEGVVRRLIAEAERYADSVEGTTERHSRYRAWMEKQATYYGPGSSHGARVSAISQLMKIEGMDAPIKTETELMYKGGVMMVPALTNPDDWGKHAAQSQTELKETVKE